MSTLNEQQLFEAWLDAPICDGDRVRYSSDAVDMAYVAWKEGRAPLLSRIEELQSRIDALSKAATELVDLYMENQGTDSEFISCITLGPHPECVNTETYKAWCRLRDAAISAREGV